MKSTLFEIAQSWMKRAAQLERGLEQVASTAPGKVFRSKRQMETHATVVKLAKTCAQEAHFLQDREMARQMWRLALEYQRKAAALDNGQLPDIGRPPPWFE